MERSLEADKARTIGSIVNFQNASSNCRSRYTIGTAIILDIEFGLAGRIAKVRGVKRKKRTPGSKTRYSDHPHLVR
jgi:hypothetical protein